MKQNKSVQSVQSDQARIRSFKAATLGGVVYFTTFGFPLINETLPFGVWQAVLVLAKPIIMGLLFAIVYGKGKAKFVYLSSLGLTGVGLLIRYFMTSGELPNEVIFTSANILVYLAFFPTLIALVYIVIVKFLMMPKQVK